MHVFETEPKTRGKRDISKVCTCGWGGGGAKGAGHVKTETLIDIVYQRDKWAGVLHVYFGIK